MGNYNWYDTYKCKILDITERFSLKGDEITVSAKELNKVSGNSIVKAKKVTILYDDEGVDEGVDIVTIPSGEALLSISARVITAWDSDTSDVVDIGWGCGFNELYSDKDLQTEGLITQVSGAVPSAIFDEDTDIMAVITSVDDNEELSQGELEIIVTYTATAESE